MKTVEIVSIGDELLRGIVQESNSYWLAKRIAARGARLTRAQLLPDDPPVVAEELRAALARRPSLIVTHGGLGPTDDDRTREAVALALGREQVLDEEAASIVRRRYAELAEQGRVADAEESASRMRMAMLPAGARAIDNQVGAAPSFAVQEGDTTIVALPGVPPELVWIWENPLAPLLDDILGPGGFAEVTLGTDTHDESAIAFLLPHVARRHDGVYVKSRAHGFAETERIRITVAASAPTREEAQARVDAATADLRAALRAEGVALLAEAPG